MSAARPRALGVLALTAAATISAGCGPPPPKAPPAQAGAASDALGAIVQDCGEAYQTRALGAAGASLASEQSDALAKGRELAGVFHANPKWVYQGETLRQIVALSIHYLHSCGLGAAAQALERETR